MQLIIFISFSSCSKLKKFIVITNDDGGGREMVSWGRAHKKCGALRESSKAKKYIVVRIS